jgi:hypothetical protein
LREMRRVKKYKTAKGVKVVPAASAVIDQVK